MRVIAGKAKGRRLFAVPGEATRPISDRVKEALFSTLGELVEGARFLDLFAGTGSVGIEALSRRAQEATFVERSWQAVKVIRQNLEVTGLAEQAVVVRQDVFRFLRAAEGPYDIIYIAPPQYQGLWARTLEALDERRILSAGGLAIAQIFPKEYQPLELKTLALQEQRKYGSTLLCFYGPCGEKS